MQIQGPPLSGLGAADRTERQEVATRKQEWSNYYGGYVSEESDESRKLVARPA